MEDGFTGNEQGELKSGKRRRILVFSENIYNGKSKKPPY